MNPERNSPKMTFALERLRAERIRHEQTSEFQIKVGRYNFYPGKGTIFMDGDRKARPERGLENFIDQVRKLGDRNTPAFKENTAPRISNRAIGFDIRDAISDPSSEECITPSYEAAFR